MSVVSGCTCDSFKGKLLHLGRKGFSSVFSSIVVLPVLFSGIFHGLVQTPRPFILLHSIMKGLGRHLLLCN